MIMQLMYKNTYRCIFICVTKLREFNETLWVLLNLYGSFTEINIIGCKNYSGTIIYLYVR